MCLLYAQTQFLLLQFAHTLVQKTLLQMQISPRPPGSHVKCTIDTRYFCVCVCPVFNSSQEVYRHHTPIVEPISTTVASSDRGRLRHLPPSISNQTIRHLQSASAALSHPALLLLPYLVSERFVATLLALKVILLCTLAG